MRPLRNHIAFSLLGLTSMHAAADAPGGATLCDRWSEPVQVGTLDVATIMEASGIGIAASGGRLYHINDGNAPQFFVTDATGAALQAVRVAGFTPLDLEDLAYGRCGDSSCLYLADTGDNAVRRAQVQIAVVREMERYPDEVTPLRVITARYPDGPQDVEAVALHPAGDLLVATKRRVGIGGTAQLFRLRAAQLEADGEQVFEALGAIPLPSLTHIGQALRRVVTAMDISPEGDRIMLLTYDVAIEVAFAPGVTLPQEWTEGVTHQSIAIAPLIQAEAIAYEGDGRSILYSTESVRGSAAPLMRQSCTAPGR